MHYDGRIDLRIFEGETTNKNDFRIPPAECVLTREIYRWNDRKKERPPVQPRKAIQECHETFSKFRENKYVPFNLLHTEPPITGKKTCDRTIPTQPVDYGKEDAINTRPKHCMPPAVNIDNVADKKVREMLINYMYTTDMKKAQQDTAQYLQEKRKQERERKQGICEKPDQVNKTEYEFMVQDLPNPMTNQKGNYPFPGVPISWKPHFDKWDKNQLRALTNPNLYFWENKDPPVKCGACENPLKDVVPQEVKDEIKELIRTKKLRFPHDKPVQGYAGYRVAMATGVPLRANEFHFTHPMLSTYQVITSRYTYDPQE